MARSRKGKTTQYRMLGQFLTADENTVNGVLLEDVETGTNIRSTVLEAKTLYEQGKVDLPPY